MRRIATLIVGLGLLAVTACSGDAEPSPPPSPTPTVTTAVPTPSSSPTAPVMPEAAREHTEAGAKAFVEYFWEVVDYAGTTLDSSALRKLAADDCVGCQGAVDFVDQMRAGGATFVGATTHVTNLAFDTVMLGAQERTEVVFDVTTPEQTADYPGSVNDERYAATTTHTRFYLKAVARGWRVVLWESA
jgi:hypothetical protein